MPKFSKRQLLSALAVVLAIVAVVGGGYLYAHAGEVYVDKAEISAPHIDLSANGSGILQAVYVNEGDLVPADTVVARVGNELVKTKVEALVVSVHADIGKTLAPGTPVVTVIDPGKLRLVGHLEEDKGLHLVQVGDTASFTVDAFGSKRYVGTVDEVAPASRDADLVFSISDKRESKVFDVFVRFDATTAAELKDGMSAKLWIETK
jgi:multidrug resistance efflux pump